MGVKLSLCGFEGTPKPFMISWKFEFKGVKNDLKQLYT